MITICSATAFCVTAILPDFRALTSTAQIAGRISDLPDVVVGGAQIRVFLTTSSNLTNSYVPFSQRNNNGTSAKLSEDSHARLNQWFNSVFSQTAPFTFGTTSRKLPDVRSHGIYNLDFGLDKNNPIGGDGRFSLQIRGEFFNAFNPVQSYYPGLAVGTPQLGVVSGLYNQPRQIQVALKLIF